MSAENKTVIRRLFQEVWNRGNLAVADETFSNDYVNHTPHPGGLPPGLEGFKQLVAMLRATFPDFQMTLEDLIAGEDKVVARWTGLGTHKDDPMDRWLTMRGIDIFLIAGGRIGESWVHSDQPEEGKSDQS